MANLILPKNWFLSPCCICELRENLSVAVSYVLLVLSQLMPRETERYSFVVLFSRFWKACELDEAKWLKFILNMHSLKNYPFQGIVVPVWNGLKVVCMVRPLLWAPKLIFYLFFIVHTFLASKFKVVTRRMQKMLFLSKKYCKSLC